MIKCKECKKGFKDNLGGQLTTHLRKAHKMEMVDYVIKHKLDGKPPKCICGLCDLPPAFARGVFKRYALTHDKFKTREKLYIKKYGKPKCKEKSCKKAVTFVRGKPKSYCSQRCSGLNAGFSLKKTQEKIKKVVKKKYGVKNVGQLPHIAKGSSKKMKARWAKGEVVMDETWKKAIGKGSKRNWKKESYRKKQAHWRKNRTPAQKAATLRKMFAGSKNRLSKLHQRLRKELGLTKLGFVSEQRVGAYFADELNEKKKVIVEINGDYVHANPKLYEAKFNVRLRGQSFLAEEKWAADAKRSENLRRMGYTVIVVWESDDIEMKRQEIKNVIDTRTI